MEKIHLNYRLTYLKDTALATGLDDGNIQVISNLISNNNSDIVQSILLEDTNISKVFDKLKEKDISVRKEAINFLSEIFSIAKNLQMQGRINLISSMKNTEEFNLSIFVRECISFRTEVLGSEVKDIQNIEESEKLLTNALDIFMNYLQSIPLSLSDLCNENKTSKETEKLLQALTEQMISCQSQGLMLQIHELIKYLLESDNAICNTFYEISYKKFSDFLNEEYKSQEREEVELADLAKSLAVDIINKSILDYNARNYLQNYNVIDSVNNMYKLNSKVLNMSIIKFHKTLLVSNFMPYITQMIKLNLLDSVVDIFDKITNKKNLIASIVLDLFATIDKKGYHELAKHLCDRHEIVKPFLKNCADQFQPKVSYSVLQTIMAID